MKAIVVFHDLGADVHPLARFLQPGFKHCFVCVLSNGLWIGIDGQAGIPVVKYMTDEKFDLGAHYRAEGCTVVETEQRTKPIRAPFVATNCVSLVKVALCVRAPFAVTPYQLYRHLLKEPTCS